MSLKRTTSVGTAKRRKMLEYIIAYWQEHMRAPTLRAIQQACEISSLSVVRFHLMRMREDGTISFEEHVAGSVRPVNLRVSFDEGDGHEQ